MNLSLGKRVTPVPEKLKEGFTKAKDWWKSVAKKTKIMLGSVLLAVLIVLGVIVAVNLNQPYSVLFTGLNQSELSEIVSYLSDNGVSDYRISGNDTILVPESQEYQLKADLIMSGYPTSDSDHAAYFENVGSLTTESERRTLLLYDLEDSLEAVIRCLDGVSDATVKITPQEDNSYVLDRSNVLEAKASVMVVMESGAQLTNDQVTAIRNFVSHAVQGLEISGVSVIDSYGNSYSADGTLSGVQDVSSLKLQLEEQVNNFVRTRVFQVLSPFYGEDNISVSVNSTVDVDRRVTEATDYSTEPWADGSEGIIGREIYDNGLVRGEGDTAGGVAGTETNADINTYVENQVQANGDETAIQSSGERDYLVDQSTTQTEHLAGTITDVMVAVSINQTTAGNVNIADLYTHIGRAAGISSDMQQDKISILVQPFYQEQAPGIIVPESVQPWLLYVVAAGLLLFLLILFTVLLLGRRRRRRRAAEAEALLEQGVPVVQQTGRAPEMDPNLARTLQLKKDVRQFVETNPEIAAQMVKGWLKEGDDRNE